MSDQPINRTLGVSEEAYAEVDRLSAELGMTKRALLDRVVRVARRHLHELVGPQPTIANGPGSPEPRTPSPEPSASDAPQEVAP